MPKFVRVAQEDPMATLCRMVLGINYKDLPKEVVNRVKYAILDTTAISIGGSAMEGIPAVVDLVKEKGGKPESIIPFYGGKVPASEAAFAIGPMARAMDCGDLHAEAGHVSEYIFATLLAATGLKNKVTGKEFITAFAVGQEVLVRIGVAYKLISKALPIGWDSGGHYIFGAVAAAGKLLGLNQEELENAEGIVRTMTQPRTQSIYTPPTLMVRVHHGFVCQDAINACLLAKKGITGPRQGNLGGPLGYLASVKWQTEPDALTFELGDRWNLLDIITKSYVSCYFTHTSADGILNQMKKYNFKVEDIAKLHIDVSPGGWCAVCQPEEKRWNPESIPDCQFSLPYVVATAAFDKEVSLSSYTPEARARRDIRELMSRISASEDKSLTSWAARVSTTLKDGREFTQEYIHIKGMPHNPFTEEDFINKFNMCVRSSVYEISQESVDSVIKNILHLEKVDDVVSAILLPLTPS